MGKSNLLTSVTKCRVNAVKYKGIHSFTRPLFIIVGNATMKMIKGVITRVEGLALLRQSAGARYSANQRKGMIVESLN